MTDEEREEEYVAILSARIAELEAQLFAGNDWLNARVAVLQELAEANARIAELEATIRKFQLVENAPTMADLRAARDALGEKDDA